ncbi:hypothetical protein Nepgr_018022 [Nepenthes gracilis]|uniref:Uncharacterized protein n=1 Tax=Nepenthes gracilis TaxID=150966 RepID=A0AAD3ST23_NEPGR|nr:hypothetical protein Nepgr_018022 [Nepenthes gracilis]
MPSSYPVVLPNEVECPGISLAEKAFVEDLEEAPASVSPLAAAVSLNLDDAVSVGHPRDILLGALVHSSNGCAGIPIDEAGQTSNFDLHDDLDTDALFPLQQGGYRVINQGAVGEFPLPFADATKSA